MGRIKKTAGPKHEATLSPAVSEFVKAGCIVPLAALPNHIASFPQGWPFPKGDLYHWIPLLNRYDGILASFSTEYGLGAGPQMRQFGTLLLEKEDTEKASTGGGLTSDIGRLCPGGDRQLIEAILKHSQTLLENCGNRSLYNSSDRLSNLLNTTSLPLLSTTLQLSLRLAQRYHASRRSSPATAHHLSTALLATHYNIDLEKVQKIANTFVRVSSPQSSGTADSSSIPSENEKSLDIHHEAADLLTLVQDASPLTNGSSRRQSGNDSLSQQSDWQSWGGIDLLYYRSPAITAEDQKAPATPTPVRRTSGLSRPSRNASSEDSAESVSTPSIPRVGDANVGGMKHMEISASRILSSELEDIISDSLESLPKDSHYELLSRLRTTRAVMSSLAQRQEAVLVRLLAISNLAYIYPETIFQQKVLQQDADAPRRLQLVHQLASLLNPPGASETTIPVKLQAAVLGTLEALTKHKSKEPEVCSALSINVNHGILFYVLRTAVAELAMEDAQDLDIEIEERRHAILTLVENLPASHNRVGETLVAAGLLEILIDALNLRTRKAERHFPKILSILGKVIYMPRDTLQTFANAKGLDAVSDLIAYEVQSGYDHAHKGDGMPKEFRSPIIDYQIPFCQRETLRELSRSISKMMQNSSGNFDRLLRNFIDSPQLLKGLRTVIINSGIYGASIWSGAVNIMSSFIHNEPTSYAIISESGLSIGLLESISGKSLDVNNVNSIVNAYSATSNGNVDSETSIRDINDTTFRREALITDMRKQRHLPRGPDHILAHGILPHIDAILAIPQAFGAICLNHSGMELFMASGALDRFFEVFESHDHVKAMSSSQLDYDCPRMLGNAFDELVRHHPNLKQPVLYAVMTMLVRVKIVCQQRGSRSGCGAKLWLSSDDGNAFPAGEKNIKEPTDGDDDIIMADASGDERPSSSNQDASESLVVKRESDGHMVRVVCHVCHRSDFSEPDDFLAHCRTAHMLDPLNFEAALARNSKELEQSNGPNEEKEQVLSRNAAIEASSDGIYVSRTGDVDEKEGQVISSYIEIAMRFLSGLFENTSLCARFIEYHGAEAVLDLATLRYLQYDFNNQAASQEVAKVIHMLAEQKAWLVLPDLLRRTLVETEKLAPFYRYEEGDGFFTEFTSSSHARTDSKAEIGTTLARALLNVHTLCNILYEVFSLPILNTRQSQTPFSQVNLADMYRQIIERLGLLHRVCVWEEILLQKRLPDAWKEATRIKGYGMGSEEADEVFGFINGNADDADETSEEPANGADAQPGDHPPAEEKKTRKASISKDETTAQFRNARTLRYLLSQIPSCIVPFFQGLGKALVAKRRPDPYPRQNAYMVAESMSQANLQQLSYDAPKNSDSAKDRYAYWIVILTSMSQLMIEGTVERPHPQVLTLLLQTFKNDGGLDAVKNILRVFYEEVKAYNSVVQGDANTGDRAARMTSAYGGIKIILSFYAQVTASKAITDSSQSHALVSSESSRGHANYFCAQQLLVELRLAVLPDITMLWGSDFVDKASMSIIKCLIEILRTILDAGDEHEAFRRGEDLPVRRKASHKVFNMKSDCVRNLTDMGFDRHLAQEATYRCVNDRSHALDYCNHITGRFAVPRLPIPDYDEEKHRRSSNQTPHRSETSNTPRLVPSDTVPINHAPANITDQATFDAAGTLAQLAQGGQIINPGDTSVEVEEAESESNHDNGRPPPPAPGVPPGQGIGPPEVQMSIDNLLGITPEMIAQVHQALPPSSLFPPQPSPNAASSSESQANAPATPIESARGPPPVTVEDLNEKRADVKINLIDRVLDVLNVHDDATFELASLIGAAALNDHPDKSSHSEIAQTLVEALISFTFEEDFRPSGKKVAAYAHLLGIVIQEPQFLSACKDFLRENMDSLLGFVKIFPDQQPDTPSPWVGMILLIIEKALTEDSQPIQVDWKPSDPEQPPVSDLIALPPQIVHLDARIKLFDALLEMMPRVGKDQSLVLSIVRVLVILTRSRTFATRLSDKRNVQRLFLMIKQLSGMTDEKLPGSFMILLRHVVEEQDVVKQIMRSELVSTFDTRAGRPSDVPVYIKQMQHLIVRSPEIFIDVTNEKVEITKYDKELANHRNHFLSLKPEPKIAVESEAPKTPMESEAMKEVDSQPTPDIAKPPISGGDQQVSPSKGKMPETKAPVVEHPSGMIHYLLSELLAYKDVEDKDIGSASVAKESSEQRGRQSNTGIPNTLQIPPLMPGHDDTESPSDSGDGKTTDKPQFKIEQHPIYIYRSFILQCLTELLQSYNRVKIEFINFSRKAEPKAMTPSKPRSGVLNYLLQDVIPMGTLNQSDTIAFKKRHNTSNWAVSLIVALCMRTNEAGYPSKPGSVDEDDQPELLFVRKFVLEHALKAYKDASSSEEHPDVKYCRLMDISDLFQRLLMGRLVASGNPTQNSEIGFQKSIARLMYEKNFIAALTSSIADVDLSFPGSKRAIKYILRPLKQLTQYAIVLSESSSTATTPGTTEEDEISTASSVSDVADEREETPDLFRNSTLDMFEPSHEEESGSGSEEDEDEMEYDEDEEAMEYEEEMDRDGDEVISDEDEDLDEAGHIEGLHGDVGMDVEVVMEGDEDDDEDDDDDDDDDEDDDEDPDDSEDMDDVDGDVEILEEITGDEENASLAEGHEGWQDDMDDGEDVAEYDIEAGDDSQDPAESAVRELMQGFGGPGGPLQHIEGLGEGHADLVMDINEGRYMNDVVRAGEDDDDDNDDEAGDEDLEEDDVIYHPDFDGDDRGMMDEGVEWDPDDESFPSDRQHNHHHHRQYISHRLNNPWEMVHDGAASLRNSMSLYRHHRPLSGTARSNDDGANPLLRRTNSSVSPGGLRSGPLGLPTTTASLGDHWVSGMESGPGASRGLMADSPVSFVNSIIAAIGNTGQPMAQIAGGPGGPAIHLHIGGPRGSNVGDLPPELQALLGTPRPHHHEPPRTHRDDQPHLAVILPSPTFQRWQEEARLMYSGNVNDKAMRLQNSIFRLLVPPAIEKRKQQEETTKRLKEQQEKFKQQERDMKEELEKKERQVREENERQQLEEAQAAQERSNQETPDVQERSGESGADQATAMEGVEDTTEESTRADRSDASQNPDNEGSTSHTAGPSTNTNQANETSQPTERIITRLGDREIDITGLGIDLAYLDALPEDIRQEVLVSQIAVQRSESANAGEPPTDISAEFLDALPPEIRAELLQQEAQTRRRREREEIRRQQQPSAGGGPRAEDMDPASFLASLDPQLRQHVLAEQDDEMLAHLPPEIAAEARALGGDRAFPSFPGMPGRGNRGLARHLAEARGEQAPPTQKQKPPRRQIVQMLDKAGVATLLRLMFVTQQGSSRESFTAILRSICENRQNRAEVINLLLSILQDGSLDVQSIERSFNQLSLRAIQPSSQKTPQPLKRTTNGAVASVTNNLEVTPLTVIQQCLSTLVSLTQANPHIPSFFLTEHDSTAALKSKANRKGKGKDTKACRYAINALLGLLDRKLIMESSSCLEQLASLLQSVTHPLNMLSKKNKEEVAKTEKAKTTEGGNTSATVSAVADTSNPEARAEIDSQATVSEPPTASPMQDVQTTTDTDQAADSAPLGNEETKRPAAEKIEVDSKAKKTHALTPPIIPEANLRLVVSIIAARECSKRTFQQTVATISNLKAIPGAKEIFGKGLIEAAQILGQSILEDLDDLTSQIKKADSGTDIQGLALSKFATASSDQSKLLRVLTALDYLFGVKSSQIAGKNKAGETTKEDDMLTELYENSAFGPLWEKLSDCLSAIRHGEGMLNIASILQPLIEALMVVCKNTALKDSPLVRSQKDFAITSPAPESRMESLFFKFTEDHRKILNELVRHSPKLMMGTFSLLVKNPKVLEFDNKRSYFGRRLHSRGTEARHPQPPLQLHVRRDQVFLDSFKFLSFKTGDEIKFGKLSIRFTGEEGVDAGGVTREWFQVMSRQMFNPDYALFIPVASDRTTFHPNKLSKVNEEHLMFFKFIGRIIGKALYEGRALDCHFSRAVYKRILGKTVSIKDMETLDLDYYKSLLWMLENDITDIITETFSVETDDFGVVEVVDLIENGRNVPVSEENKQEYVQLVIEYRLTGSVQTQLEKFLEGFHDIVPPELIAIFNEQELELLISGLPDIDVDDWKNHTEYHNYQAASPQIQWFWRAVRSFDKEERAKLLQFVTGTSKVPLNGFGQLEGMNGFSRFNIHRDYGNKERLPSSHTCFNQLDLPEYESYEALRSHVYTAMTAGSEYFGFA